LRKSFELEDSFWNLNNIPRSEIQKRKTYNTILHTRRPERHAFYMVKNWTSGFLTLVMILACTAFLINEIKTPAQDRQTAVVPTQVLEANVPVITYLAKSDSAEHFNLQANLTRKGVSIIDEAAWMESLNRTVNRQNQVEAGPPIENGYDLLLIYEDQKPVKCKLWIHEESVYMKSLKDNHVFKMEEEKAKKIISMIRDMEKQVQF
jgi:hypothetical protein